MAATKLTKAGEIIQRIPTEYWQKTVLAVDPSCGSQRSMPAYAIAHGGQVVDSGRIELPLKFTKDYAAVGYKPGDTVPLHVRLHRLQEFLRQLVPGPSIVCIEDLPPFMANRGGDFRTAGTIALHQAAGCVMSTWDTFLVPIAIASHQSLMKKLCAKADKEYIKSDENDALSILASAFNQAGVELKNLNQLIDEVTTSEP